MDALSTLRVIAALRRYVFAVTKAKEFARRARSRGSQGPPFLAIAVLLSFFLSISSSAQQQHPTDSQVKAAYLYNFGKFVRWQPDHPTNPEMLICILGKDPFGPILDTTVEGESIDGRKLAVKRFARVQDAASCSILFISSSEESQLGSILVVAKRFRVLTVSDIPRFAERGGVIGFVLQQDKIRFEVNRSAAEQAHLTLSSELLKVASRLYNKAAEQ